MQNILCLKCGGPLEISSEKTHVVCPYCDSEFLLDSDRLEYIEKEWKKYSLKHGYLNIVQELCSSHKPKDDAYFFTGSSLKKKRFFKKVQKYFQIPKEDDAYLIYDSSSIATRKLGFALCESGIYYRENRYKKCGKIEWYDFKELKIYAVGNDYLFLGELYFEVFSSAQEVSKLLNTIQSQI